MSILTTPLADHRRTLMACRLCPGLLHCVPPTGPSNPLLFIIGQAPAEAEVDRGMPFVGESGQLLDRLLEEAGVPRSSCFITNAVKCRLPKRYPNEPSPEELDNCRQYLLAELKLLQPPAVLCLGRDAYRIFSKRLPWKDGLLVETVPSGKRLIPRILVSYHPSYWLHRQDPEGFLKLAVKVRRLVYGAGTEAEADGRDSHLAGQDATGSC